MPVGWGWAHLVHFIHHDRVRWVMAFKKKTDLIAISGGLSESGANTFTQQEVSLDLDPLSREIFVVTDCYLDPSLPDLVPATHTVVNASLSSTTRTAVGSIGTSDVILNVREDVLGGAAEYSFARTAAPNPDTSTGSNRDYLGIIATPNFFVQVKGSNNTGAKGVNYRVVGYRAIADADTFAALVASEVLSV